MASSVHVSKDMYTLIVFQVQLTIPLHASNSFHKQCLIFCWLFPTWFWKGRMEAQNMLIFLQELCCFWNQKIIQFNVCNDIHVYTCTHKHNDTIIVHVIIYPLTGLALLKWSRFFWKMTGLDSRRLLMYNKTLVSLLLIVNSEILLLKNFTCMHIYIHTLTLIISIPLLFSSTTFLALTALKHVACSHNGEQQEWCIKILASFLSCVWCGICT